MGRQGLGNSSQDAVSCVENIGRVHRTPQRTLDLHDLIYDAAAGTTLDDFVLEVLTAAWLMSFTRRASEVDRRS